jgi:hypothetical protein
MNSQTFFKQGKLLVSSAAAAAVLFAPSAVNIAWAAPQSVSYFGQRVTAAVPGKPFNLNFRVQNTSSDTYSDIKVIFHIPDGLNVTKVGPANANVDEGTITWSNVPLEPGKSFYPAFTFTIASGTPLNTKFNIWVEVTGSGMEGTSTNFSVTAKKSVTAAASSALSAADVNAIFNSVYGRQPTASEAKYWQGRRADKPAKNALLGAIAFAQAHNIKH